ncbi:MAG: FapA family protein [Spirochaetales bacterium]
MSAHADGSFELYYQHGWVYLVVHPHDGEGQPVYHEDVENRMKILGMPHVSPGSVREVVERAEGLPVRLVEWPAGQRLASAITVGVDDDEMSAWVELTPPKKGAAPPTIADVMDALRDAGVVRGTDEEAIAQLLVDERYGERVTVARGAEPVHARSAEIVYHFDPDRGRPFLVMEFDRINLRELNFIENKHAGDLLAELAPPVRPKDGATVRGALVPARTEAQPVALVAGENTEQSEDGTKVFAAADGNVRIANGAIIVEPVVTVERVGYETGNIHFEGAVVVEKDIADGFEVEAGGDVQVGRGVGRAAIRSGGNVLLKTGINGNGAGVIECEGNLLAKYVERSAVTAHGTVFVEEAIMHSRVTTWKHCVLGGRRSEVIASNLVVAGTLWCKKLGSVAEAPTRVCVGVDPELLGAFRESRERLATCETRRDEIALRIDQIDRAIGDGHTDDRLPATREQLAAELVELQDEIPGVRRRVHDLRESLDASRESKLVVEDTIFKGAVVLFGTHEYHAPEKGARKTVLRMGVEGIVEEGFNPAERPSIPFER